MTRASKSNAVRYLYIALFLMAGVILYQYYEKFQYRIAEEIKHTERYRSLYDETVKKLEDVTLKCEHEATLKAEEKFKGAHSEDNAEDENDDLNKEMSHLRAVVIQLRQKLADAERRGIDPNEDSDSPPVRLTETIGDPDVDPSDENVIEHNHWTQKEERVDPKTLKNHDNVKENPEHASHAFMDSTGENGEIVDDNNDKGGDEDSENDSAANDNGADDNGVDGASADDVDNDGNGGNPKNPVKKDASGKGN